MTDSQKLDMILSQFQGFQADMEIMKADMQNMKADIQNMKADIQNMKTDIQNMKADIQNMKADIQDLKIRVTNIELHLENTTDKNIKLLAENHLTLVDKLNEAIKVSDNTKLYEMKVNLLTERVDKLEQKVDGLKNGTSIVADDAKPYK